MRWYTYDDCGNILSKKVYAYTSPDVTPTGSCTEYEYEYEGGRLRSFNGEFVDCINLEPETYRDNELTWSRGRNLVSYCCNRFAYDGNGLRVAKNDIEYVYIGDRLAQEIRKDTSGNAQHTYIDYLYDDTGIAGFVYNDTRLPDGKKTYFYVKNIFGDVIAICENSADSCGVVAKYAYDAWGKCSVSYDNGSGISAINPIRYRGYYYDTETGLYYLQSRYYDPEVGRFINADIAEYVDPENFGGTNLYAYCLNNPVMYVDPSGHFWDYVLDGIFLAIGIYDFAKEPSWSKAGLLGVDIALSLLPIIPSISSLRHLGKLDDAVDLTKTYGHIDNFADAGGTIRWAEKSDFKRKSFKLVKGVDRTDDGFTISNHVLGTKIHSRFMDGGAIINKLNKVDGLDTNLKIVYELKPYNKRNIRKGIKQLYRYRDALIAEGYGIYKMVLVVY